MIVIEFQHFPPEEAYSWCFEQFGRPTHWLSNEGWRYNSGTYFFSGEQDAVSFLLRWGGTIRKPKYAVPVFVSYG